jgi:hypothetical protein
VYIGQDTQGPANHTSSSLPPFRYGNGYSLTAFDLGNGGVKLELHCDGEIGAAIILPSAEVQKLGKWLLRTLGQDEHGFPVELAAVLERVSKAKIAASELQRGDKKRIKEALRALRD